MPKILGSGISWLYVRAIDETIDPFAGTGNSVYDNPVTTGGTTVNHTFPFANTDYIIVGRCFDGSGNNIDYLIDNKLAGSYDVTSAINGSWDGIAMTYSDLNSIGANSQAVTTGGTTITGLEFSSASDYSILVRCYDASGNNIDFRITNRTASSFKVTPAINGTIDYLCVNKDYDTGIRSDNRMSATTGGTAITFDTWGGTGYAIVIRCYDSDGDNIDYTITAKGNDTFTVTPAQDGYVDYVLY